MHKISGAVIGLFNSNKTHTHSVLHFDIQLFCFVWQIFERSVQSHLDWNHGTHGWLDMDDRAGNEREGRLY
jgi:hypothetical protein